LPWAPTCHGLALHSI